MKRILMAMLVAGMLAVAIPFAPVQVEEAEARPDCQAVDRDHDGIVSSGDIWPVLMGPSHSGNDNNNALVEALYQEFGTTC
jgi:hypothetical protein